MGRTDNLCTSLQTVVQGNEHWLKLPRLCFLVVLAELPSEGVHGLTRGEGLIAEAIIKR